jgi:hypothetical protein
MLDPATATRLVRSEKYSPWHGDVLHSGQRQRKRTECSGSSKASVSVRSNRGLERPVGQVKAVETVMSVTPSVSARVANGTSVPDGEAAGLLTSRITRLRSPSQTSKPGGSVASRLEASPLTVAGAVTALVPDGSPAPCSLLGPLPFGVGAPPNPRTLARIQGPVNAAPCIDLINPRELTETPNLGY